MIVYHVAIATAPDYIARHEPHRREHFEHLMALRAQGAILALGTATDGTGADLVCRVGQPDDVRSLMESMPLSRAGLWTDFAPRSFAQFLEPWALAAPSPDDSRVATVIEGATDDAEMASFAMIEERGAGRLLLGGFFPDGACLAFTTLADPAAAVAALDASGLFTAGSLRARSLVHTV